MGNAACHVVVIGAEWQRACPGRRAVPGLSGLSALLVLVQCCRMMILSERHRAFKLPLLVGRCRRMKGRSGCKTPLREKKPPGNCGKRVEEERGSSSSELKWKDDAYTFSPLLGKRGHRTFQKPGMLTRKRLQAGRSVPSRVKEGAGRCCLVASRAKFPGAVPSCPAQALLLRVRTAFSSCLQRGFPYSPDSCRLHGPCGHAAGSSEV